MLKRASAVRSKATAAAVATPSSVANTKPVVDDNVPSSYYSSPNNNNNNQPSSSSATTTPDDEVIERVRLRISNAHVFKLPPKPTSGGWRGAEWRDKVWQGTLKVVERGHHHHHDDDDTSTTLVLLVDASDERNIFAICPIRHDVVYENTTTTTTTAAANGGSGGGGSNAGNGVDRCIDSSRYFVLRIRNVQTGRHMYIGLAFNERNDAFDFNTSLEDSRREKEMDRRAELLAKEMELLGGVTANNDDTACGGGGGSGRGVVGGTNYTMKEGEKIHVKIPVLTNNNDNDDDDVDDDDNTTTAESLSPRQRQKITSKNKNKAVSKSSGGGFLKPCQRDTPSRLALARSSRA
jgi:hypothetical protein